MNRSHWTLALAALLWAGCGKKEPARNVAAEVDARWSALKPALAAFRAGYGTDCRVARVKELDGWTAYDADALDAVLAGKDGVDRLGLYSSLIALRPGAAMSERELGEAARALDELKALDGGALLIYRIAELSLPALGADASGLAGKEFLGGRVKVEAMFIDPKTFEPLCLVSAEAENTRQLAVPREAEAARAAIGADLMKNARAALEQRLRTFR